jgi:hypothetical protein
MLGLARVKHAFLFHNKCMRTINELHTVCGGGVIICLAEGTQLPFSPERVKDGTLETGERRVQKR